METNALVAKDFQGRCGEGEKMRSELSEADAKRIREAWKQVHEVVKQFIEAIRDVAEKLKEILPMIFQATYKQGPPGRSFREREQMEQNKITAMFKQYERKKINAAERIYTALKRRQNKQQKGTGKHMDKGKVIKVLEFYRTIDKDVQFNKRIIHDLEDQYYPSIGVANIDGMPKGKGKTSSPVEAIVLNVPETVFNTLKELEEQNKKLCKLKTEILREMNALSHVSRVIIVAFYIEGQQWAQITGQVNYSERQCKNIRDNALDKLTTRFAKNRTVSVYEFPQ
jgi:nucleoid DNA-binding protein